MSLFLKYQGSKKCWNKNWWWKISLTFLHWKGRWVTQVYIELKCTSGLLLLEVRKTRRSEGPFWEDSAGVCWGQMTTSVHGGRSGSRHPHETGALKGAKIDAEVGAVLIPGFLKTAPPVSLSPQGCYRLNQQTGTPYKTTRHPKQRQQKQI